MWRELGPSSRARARRVLRPLVHPLGKPDGLSGRLPLCATWIEAAICFERAAELQDLADRTANAKQLRDEVNLMRANAEMWSRPHGLSQSHGCVDFSTERAMAQWRERMSLQMPPCRDM